ncbi:hypothetical protein NIIDNTM18_42580 [Mycolicibacterium litorale]|uniref:Uncharacterized protein n=1 Tax=Mycolicibacterium litorale TaxID=758802 RepID=A0A6S6PEA2_9MYCO|nr:hypothetical protein NIIDNTM18_42580 [Mycolicibacterium litorale]
MSNTPSPHRPEVVEAVAIAICQSANDLRTTDLARAYVAQYPRYRHLAEAAIEAHTAALGGLTEEWAVKRGQGVWAYVSTKRFPDEESAQKSADRINKRYWDEHKGVAGAAIAEPNAHPVSRTVSPWRRAESGEPCASCDYTDNGYCGCACHGGRAESGDTQ